MQRKANLPLTLTADRLTLNERARLRGCGALSWPSWGDLLLAAAAAVISGRLRVVVASQGSMYFPGTYATGNGYTQVTEVGGE